VAEASRHAVGRGADPLDSHAASARETMAAEWLLCGAICAGPCSKLGWVPWPFARELAKEYSWRGHGGSCVVQ
jgi:hypothetical protein